MLVIREGVGFGCGFGVGSDQVLWWVLGGGLVVDVVVVLGL